MMEQSVYIPLLTFFVGLIGGHHFALIRDKRKEFNAASLSLFEKLYKGIHTKNTSEFPNKMELDLFVSHVVFYKKHQYRQAIFELESSLKADVEARKWNAKEAEDQIDEGYESQSIKAAEAIIMFLKRK